MIRIKQIKTDFIVNLYNMKNVLFLLFIFAHSVIFSQIEVLNYSSTESGKQIAYRNVQNFIDVLSFKDDSVMLVSNSDTLERVSGIFIYEPISNSDFDTLDVFMDGNYQGTIVFRLESLGELSISLGEWEGVGITHDYLLSNPGLQVSYTSQSYIPQFYVTSCELTIIQKGKNIKMQINGNAFSDKQLKKLRKLKVGSVLWFKTVTFSDFKESEDAKILDPSLRLTIINSPVNISW